MSGTAKKDPVRRARLVLVVSVLATFLLYIFGGPLAYPLVYLSTLVHELGHGVTALLVGGTFDRFEMWKDASGLAYTAAARPWQEGLIVAGGLVGPAFAAAVGFVLARRGRPSRFMLGGIALFLAWAMIFKVRTALGLVVAGLLAATCGWVALRAAADEAQLLLTFLSVQLALSVFSRGDYLFARGGHIGGADRPSDVSIMSQVLGGPYWGWGALCGLVSLAMLGLGGWWMLRAPRPPRARARAGAGAVAQV